MGKAPSLSNATALRDENVLRRVRHLGSARDGLQEWRLQRRTALAVIPLGLYFVASMLWLATSDQMTAAAWLASPAGEWDREESSEGGTSERDIASFLDHGPQPLACVPHVCNRPIDEKIARPSRHRDRKECPRSIALILGVGNPCERHP